MLVVRSQDCSRMNVHVLPPLLVKILGKGLKLYR